MKEDVDKVLMYEHHMKNLVDIEYLSLNQLKTAYFVVEILLH